MAMLSETRSLGVDAIFQYTSSSIQLFSGALFYIIIARLFSTTDVGAIAMFLAIIGLFNIVFSFGLGIAVRHFTSYSIGIRDYASVRRTIWNIIGYGFILALVGFAFLFLSANFISSIFLHSSAYTGLVRLLSIVLLGYILFGILNGALIGLQRFRLSALINIIVWITYYFGSIMLVVFVHSIETIIFGWILGIFFGVAIELIAILRLITKYPTSKKAFSGHVIMKYSLPVFLSGLISYGAVYIDRFIVVGLLDLSSLGIYNFALLLASSIGFIVVPFNNILLPKFSELFGVGHRNDIAEIVKGSSILLSSLYVPVALGIAALAPSILDLLGGPQYIRGAVPLMIIMFISAMFVSVNILIQAVASVRKTHFFIYSSSAGFAANIILSILLIPRLGIIGASIGYSSVAPAMFIVLYFIARKEAIIRFDLIGLVKVWISSLIMFSLVMAVEDPFELMVHHSLLPLPLYIVFGFVVYLISTRIIGVFSRENKELIISLFPERYAKIRKIVQIFILH